jgi:hypothetical protein
MDMTRKNRIAQWVFDTKNVLTRFHLWLEDVDDEWTRGEFDLDVPFSFAGGGLDRALIMATAVTALGTRVYGRPGEGVGGDKATINRVKKDADAISAYVMSEGLWYLTRNLPENHAVMVSLGEGLMPKAGETPEMGANPLLGFGRVYARPEVAQFVDRLTHRLLNEPNYGWDGFWADLNARGITVWGAAIDTLENTSRFAKGSPTGPMAVLHLFDQPLAVSQPYEGYMGTLSVPQAVVHAAGGTLDYYTPRRDVMAAILKEYPGVKPGNVHVWTLGGESREMRIGELWKTWRELGAHVVEDGWTLPGGGEAFVESGTYAPMYALGHHRDGDGEEHVIILDGYAASAEAIQAASLDPMLDIATSMAMFTSTFDVPFDREGRFMQLDPEGSSFAADVSAILGRDASKQDVDRYREMILDARNANMPLDTKTVTVDDFFPTDAWRGLALSAMMHPDPYANLPGVEEVSPNVFRVTARASTRRGTREVTLTLRLAEEPEGSRRIFQPLLDRFYHGEDYEARPVKISDSGRIRNELQTWCSGALEYSGERDVRLYLDRVEEAVLPADKKALVEKVLRWYKREHPQWFKWLEIG